MLTLLIGLYRHLPPERDGDAYLHARVVVLATGALRLVAWWHERAIPGAWMIAFNGVLTIVLGVLIAASRPTSAAWAIGLLVGINLIF